MWWKVSARHVQFRFKAISLARRLATTSRSSSRTVHQLRTWNLEDFRQNAFEPQLPAQLPRQTETPIAAQHEWFVSKAAKGGDEQLQTFSLKQASWEKYHDILVPLELTTKHQNESTFQRLQAPLRVFLHWTEQATDESFQRLYLAQCHIADLPQSLRDDVPTPDIVKKVGKGDVYDANLWIGLAPTYTPLHRDPNPNLFMQLAGRKVIKLFPPEVGAFIFAEVQEKLGRNASSAFRGEEMMQGPEKELLEREVWSRQDLRVDGFEATLDHGEALFIPLGWWHSIKGVGKGVTASVNWWFR